MDEKKIDYCPIVFADYIVSDNCTNKDTLDLCMKCGECGRKFDDNGILEETRECVNGVCEIDWGE